MVDRGQKRHPFTHMDGLAEDALVDIQRHHLAPCIAAGAGVGGLVQQFEDGATVDVA